MRDPVRIWRRRAVVSSGLSAAFVAAAVAWAIRPIELPELPELVYSEIVREVETAGSSERWDPACFDADLWVELEEETLAEQVAPAVEEPPTRLDLELVGITVTDGRRVAAIYDRDADRMHLVGHGEAFDGSTVEVRVGSIAIGTGGDAQVVAMRSAEQ